jgi:rubredoxin
MYQPPSAEIRPCPECGGKRESFQDISPESAAHSFEGSQAWGAMKKGKKFSHLALRCTQCGYLAFFMRELH